MIQRQSHATIFVIDQEESLKFYKDILGFEVKMDMPMGDTGLRWVTVCPSAQPDHELVLAPIMPGPMFDAESAEQLKALVQKGAIGIGVFETDDCQGDYERLTKLGVEFMAEPKEQFYGTEAIGKDNSGNWFSLTQRKK